MIENHKTEVFWEIIEVLHQSALLPHIMVIGSWAEYLYPHYLGDDYLPNMKTRDVDLYYRNPYLEIDGAEELIGSFRAAGFLLDEHFIDTGKLFKDGLEVEFLSSQMGSGPGVIEIPSPASYIAHKIYINPERKPASKRPKDIEAVRALLHYLEQKPEELEFFRDHVQKLPDEKQKRIVEVAAYSGLDLPEF
jgi:hypothetical protein